MKTRFTSHLSRQEAERFRKPINAVLISITDPDTDLPRFHRGVWLDVLSLRFHDLLNDDPKWAAAGYLAPGKEHAGLIAEFIAKHRDKAIVAHCEMGISRSAAVCAALRKFGWGYEEIQPHGLRRANPLLLRLLTCELDALFVEVVAPAITN